jgi:ketosteroid isomerase-like protein
MRRGWNQNANEDDGPKMMATEPAAVVERLRQSTDDHDIEALVDCFTETYRNETPAHPDRGFVGREQVRANWERIFAGVPDIRADVLRTVVDGDVVWSEWEMGGTRRDGQPQLMRGVIIFGIAGAHIAWARFYLEPVDAGDDVNAAVGRLVAEPSNGN